MFASFDEISTTSYIGEKTKSLLREVQQAFSAEYPGDFVKGITSTEVAEYLDEIVQQRHIYDIALGVDFYSTISELFKSVKNHKVQAGQIFTHLSEHMDKISVDFSYLDYADFSYALRSMRSFTKFLPKTEFEDFEMV